MIADLKPYPEYKEAGLPWLGQVPRHWDARVLKRLCSRSALYGANIPASEYVASGVRFLRTSDITDDGALRRGGVFIDPNAAHDYMLDDGDLLVSRSGTIGRSLRYRAKVHGPCAYAGYLVRFVPLPIANADYLFYFTKGMAFADFIRVSAVSSTIENVNGDKYANMPLTLPPPAEQAAIVRFLDWANGRMERAIRAKRKVIALLTEQKQAVIQSAVTRGLDPSVPLKPSGIPWLGDIPQHWEVVAVGVGTKMIQTGPFGSQLHSHEYVVGGTPVINPSHMIDDRIEPSTAITIARGKVRELARHKMCAGDVVAARRGELGRCALVTAKERDWVCGTGSLLMRCNLAMFVPAYFQLVFSSRGVADLLSLSSIGTTMANLNAGMVARLRIPCPPLDEQSRIVGFIHEERQRHAAAIARLDREIELLREYRTRLIADVVTGKLDVREAAASLPEVAEPESAVPAEDLPNEVELESESTE